MNDRLRLIRHVALDMDGTIYNGGTLFGWTNQALALFRELGVGYTFLTNNSSKSTRHYLEHLRKIGVPANADQLYTSTQATIEHLQENLPQVRRLFVLGTPSMSEEIAAAGYTLTTDNPKDEPDAVVVGFDTTLSYPRLCRTAWWIKQGKPFIATHPDRICPTDQPTVLVDCGAICAALQQASGRAPDVVLGKPDPCMIRGILHRHDLKPQNLAMVGDRLYTDMAMARRAGALGVLVLTGETTPDDIERANPRPDLVFRNLLEFAEKLEGVRPTAVP